MRVLHAYNQHRGGGGADYAARSTIEISRRYGLEVEVFTRNSEAMGKGLSGRFAAAFSAIYSPASMSAFREIMDSFRPDIVHAHEVFPFVTPWIIPEAARRGIPVVMSMPDYRLTCPMVTHLRDGQICMECTDGREHRVMLHNCRGSMAESFVVMAYNRMVRTLGLFHKHVARFIAPSEFTRSWFIEHAGIPPNRIVSNWPMIEIPPDTGDPSRGAYVAFAGRFDPEKGVDVIAAAARLAGLPCKASRNAASLVRIEVPADLDVEVTHSRQELLDFYRGARMLAVPSRALETFGLVAAEAMSHGIPVVAADIGSLPELVEHGVNGLLFPPNDAEALARTLRRLWDDPEACRQMGLAGRRKAAALWTGEAHFSRLQAIYEQVLAGQHTQVAAG